MNGPSALWLKVLQVLISSQYIFGGVTFYRSDNFYTASFQDIKGVDFVGEEGTYSLFSHKNSITVLALITENLL